MNSTIGKRVGRFNPDWNETSSSDDSMVRDVTHTRTHTRTHTHTHTHARTHARMHARTHTRTRTHTHTHTQERFQKAMDLVGSEFLEVVTYFNRSWWPAKKIVEKAIASRQEVYTYMYTVGPL